MINEEVERAVLYYIVFEHLDFDITEKDFINLKNKKIIRVINELKAKKEEVTMLTIDNKINDKQGKWLEYLSGLGEYIRTETSETAYKILKDNTKKRELYELCKKIEKETTGIEDIDIYIEKIISELQKIQFQTQQEESFVQNVTKTAEKIEANIRKKENYDLHTGFFDLDTLTDGLHKGELTIIGARPRSWKNHILFTDSR